jgi:hypothetical protein
MAFAPRGEFENLADAVGGHFEVNRLVVAAE